MKLKTLFFALLIIFAVSALPMMALAQLSGEGPSGGFSGEGSSNPQGVSNPLAGDVNSIFSFVRFILNNIVLPIGVVIVVFFVIYSGFLFVTAQGNADKLQDARQTFLWVVVGAAILLGSVAIAEAIETTVCRIAPSKYCEGQGIRSDTIFPRP